MKGGCEATVEAEVGVERETTGVTVDTCNEIFARAPFPLPRTTTTSTKIFNLRFFSNSFSPRFSSDPRLFARDMAMDCPRHLFLLVEDRFLLSPHLIDLHSVAVSSTKLCAHTPRLFITCNNTHHLFVYLGTVPLPHKKSLVTWRFTHAFVSITVYVEHSTWHRCLQRSLQYHRKSLRVTRTLGDDPTLLLDFCRLYFYRTRIKWCETLRVER